MYEIVLILAFLSTGLGYVSLTPDQQTNISCHAKCPAGYYKIGGCGNPLKEYKCKKCDNGTFTDLKNTLSKCERCSVCKHQEEEIERCTYNSDTKCDCPINHYYVRDRAFGNCRPCPEKHCEESADYDDCKRKCQSTTPGITLLMYVPTTTSTVKHTGMRATSRGTEASGTPERNPIPPSDQLSMWFLVGVAVFTFLVLLLLIKNIQKYHASCPFWCIKKDLELPVEEPKFNEQNNLQGSSLTTLTLNIPEETPIKTPKQVLVAQEHPTPTHDSPLLPVTEHKAGGKDEHSERWPAIVLYAIIKEVPLRRWKEFLRLLSVADQQLERVEIEAGLSLDSKERQYQMLKLWSQCSSASLKDVFSALHHMDLSSSAQLLQESLEKLHLRLDLKQVVATSTNFTQYGERGNAGNRKLHLQCKSTTLSLN